MADKLFLKDLMKGESTFNISGSCFNGGSHSITNCIDVAKGGDSTFSFYAPVDMYCLEISGSSNTAYFESKDPVEFANGQTGFLSMTFGHANSVPVTASAIKNASTVIAKGTKIYQEGNAGTTNIHCHIRVGKGLFKSPRVISNGTEPTYSTVEQFDINTQNGPMTFSEAFYKDNMTVTYDGVDMKKKYKWRISTTALPNNRLWVNAKYKASGIFQAPSPTKTKLATIPIGGKARIVTFLPNKRESDGYQWAFVDYNNGEQYGYARMNFNDSSTLSRDGWSTDIYLQATYQPFRVRQTIDSTTGSILINTGGSAKIVGFMSEKHTDNYQWARTSSGSITNGYSQMDMYNCYTIEYSNANDVM